MRDRAPPGLRLRRARVADAAAVAAATRATGSAPWSVAQARAELALPASRAYVAEGDGPAPAGILVARRAADELEILQLHVAPEARRRGVARALLESAVAAEPGLGRVWIEVRTDNAGARAFYLRAGFEQVGTRPGYYHDGEAALVLSRAPRGTRSG